MNFEFRGLNQSRLRSEGRWTERRRWVLLLGPILFGVVVLGYFLFWPPKSFPLSTDQNPANPTVSQEAQLQDPQPQIIEGKVKERSTFFKSLSEKNIPLQWIHLIISKLKPYANFKRIKGGTYHFIKDVKGELVKFVYEAGPTEIYEIERGNRGYVVKRKQVSLQTRLVKV